MTIVRDDGDNTNTQRSSEMGESSERYTRKCPQRRRRGKEFRGNEKKEGVERVSSERENRGKETVLVLKNPDGCQLKGARVQ